VQLFYKGGFRRFHADIDNLAAKLAYDFGGRERLNDQDTGRSQEDETAYYSGKRRGDEEFLLVCHVYGPEKDAFRISFKFGTEGQSAKTGSRQKH
jgi:hypothetical protein